jgi:membrane protein required for colicin V production
VTLFDIIALLILLLSAIIGLVRGAVREVVTVFAFAVAVILALLALRFTGPIARHAISPAWAANTAAVLVTFVAAYILIRVLGAGLSRKVQDVQALGSLDRVVGLAFGLVRGLVVLGVFQMVFSAATPADRVPRWISHAALYPLSVSCAKALRRLAPEGSAVAGRLAPHIQKAVHDGAHDPKSDDLLSGDGGSRADPGSAKETR